MKIFLNLLAAANGGQKTRALAFYSHIKRVEKEIELVILKYHDTLSDIVTEENIKINVINAT